MPNLGPALLLSYVLKAVDRAGLSSEVDPEARSLLHKLLVEEEDKLGANLELLTDIECHIMDGNRCIEKQRVLVALMERDGHNSRPQAKILLDGMLETRPCIRTTIGEF